MSVPHVVREAIAAFVVPDGFVAAPKGRLNSSVIFKWGVRLAERDDRGHYWWVCLASESCRRLAGDDRLRDQARINMLRGKTSKATMHLSRSHNVQASKTEVTLANKLRREQRLARYRASVIYQQDPGRFMVLLETQKIILNNLPFCSVESEEAIELRALCYKPELLTTTLNAKVVMHTLLELYVCTKQEIVGLLNNARMSAGSCFSMVTDFWTSKTQSKKYVGVRLYMVDASFRFRSVLLGTRQFNPNYGDRSRDKCEICRGANRASCDHIGIRYPFRRWIVGILSDFGLSATDLYGSSSDGGADVKWMMATGFKYEWEWCMAHLSNAATKAAFGLVDDAKTSKNKAMTKLQKKIINTVYQTKHVEVMGTLFEELCGPLSDTATTQLLDYRSHRFLGLTRVVARILDKWEVLREWYCAREANAARQGKPIPVFPLAGHREDLTQLLSILNRITENNALAQLESPAQVDVLLGMYKIYLNVVNPEAPLRDHRSLAPPAVPDFFAPAELTPLVSVTRKLLSEAFYSRFFKRYTCKSPEERAPFSYVFEMQLLLHPDFKTFDRSLKPVVLLCNEHHRPDDDDHMTVYTELVETIQTKLIELMAKFATPAAVPNPHHGQAMPMDENLAMFSDVRGDEEAPTILLGAVQQAEAELQLWLTDRTSLVRADNIPELITTYWARQARLKRYKLLPLAARSVFSVPASSAQLERDFGVSGMQVSPQRTSTAAHSVDMCAFVNRNREFLDPTHCMPIAEEDRIDHLPSNILVNLAPYDENDIDFHNPGPVIFSNTMVSDGEEYKEDFSDDGEYKNDYSDDDA